MAAPTRLVTMPMVCGMRGIGRTVIQGQKIEEFDFEIIGVLSGGGGVIPVRHLILFRVSGPLTDRSGGTAAPHAGQAWSSFPPHKHDTSVPGVEAKMEEIYLFRINPEKGFGTQTIYKNGSSSTFTIKDYDAVTIPWGYHPVSASPGTSLYYLWFLAGKNRELRPNTDPDFRFLEERSNA